MSQRASEHPLGNGAFHCTRVETKPAGRLIELQLNEGLRWRPERAKAFADVSELADDSRQLEGAGQRPRHQWHRRHLECHPQSHGLLAIKCAVYVEQHGANASEIEPGKVA